MPVSVGAGSHCKGLEVLLVNPLAGLVQDQDQLPLQDISPQVSLALPYQVLRKEAAGQLSS